MHKRDGRGGRSKPAACELPLLRDPALLVEREPACRLVLCVQTQPARIAEVH
jgi:hypothetical protein